MTRAPPGDLASISDLYEGLSSLLQAPESSHSSKLRSCNFELGLDTNKLAESGLTTKRATSSSRPEEFDQERTRPRSPPGLLSDKSSSSSSELQHLRVKL